MKLQRKTTLPRAPNDGATASSPSEQEVRQMMEKYRTVILQRDITTLEKIWADDYVFVNAAGNVLAKTERLANIKSGATTLDSIQRGRKYHGARVSK